jgi:signal transduction histidine kinase
VVQVTEATETAAFRRRAAALNEALLVSSVRQHELIDDIRRVEGERREVEARLFQAQKLESLGVLAGGIAHDLNNILTPVVGFAELAAASLPAASPAVRMLAEVGTNARRAADLVQQILAFAGRGRFVVQPVDLSRLVREMDRLLGAAVHVNTGLEYDLAPGLPLVEGDVTQLRQVVMNLVKNAAEAVADEAGIVTVRTGSIPDAHQAGGSLRPDEDMTGGPAVFLEVEDSGCGMTADVIAKAFDPFFTTKFTGRGLGLAVVQGIARGHRGALRIRSEPGRGSTVRFLLPALVAAYAAEPDGAAEADPTDERRGTGTVLVVDDEGGVRDTAARILEHAGYTVLAARDGQDGVRVFTEYQRRIDAVVLDLTMPRMGGLEAARVLRGVRPDLPVVLMSGFSVDEVTLQSGGLENTGFVQKPFSARALLAAVRQALGQ